MARAPQRLVRRRRGVRGGARGARERLGLGPGRALARAQLGWRRVGRGHARRQRVAHGPQRVHVGPGERPVRERHDARARTSQRVLELLLRVDGARVVQLLRRLPPPEEPAQHARALLGPLLRDDAGPEPRAEGRHLLPQHQQMRDREQLQFQGRRLERRQAPLRFR